MTVDRATAIVAALLGVLALVQAASPAVHIPLVDGNVVWFAIGAAALSLFVARDKIIEG